MLKRTDAGGFWGRVKEEGWQGRELASTQTLQELTLTQAS